MKPYRCALHIFNRDLRLEDNTALMYALANAAEVVPCFIFERKEADDERYVSGNALQFMIRSLEELDYELKRKGSRLYIFYGDTSAIVRALLKELEVDLVSLHRDYTPSTIMRDAAILEVCKGKGIDCSFFGDLLINEPEMVAKDDGKPYLIFTPFFKRSRMIVARKPRKNTATNYYTKTIDLKKIRGAKGTQEFSQGKEALEKVMPKQNKDIKLEGGRKEGLRLLKIAQELTSYDALRDYPADDYTSHLSAHTRYGTVSVREAYEAFESIPTLLKELYWRDFFYHIAFHFPHVFGKPFYEKYAAVRWNDDARAFVAWCAGMSGFPIIDAGMRELNATGYMHNRVRMIAASFLVKDLLIDWRKGEDYFAQKLIDYDPCVNNGNWQWAASTGCDAQPYFRIFNPWKQQQRFDKECIYIKRWVPELRAYPARQIHSGTGLKGYPDPIVDHAQASRKAKEAYAKSIKSRT